MVDEKKNVLVQPIKHWKTPSWETALSEHDIMQHIQIATDKCFCSQVYNHKTIHCFFLGMIALKTHLAGSNWEVQMDLENDVYCHQIRPG